MDPRVFQQQAREGALRDYLLSSLTKLPELWGDFILLTCHRVLPRLSTKFLERFVRNIGSDKEKQRQRMPYLMRYLSLAGEDPEIMHRELVDEAIWREQAKELRKYLKAPFRNC